MARKTEALEINSLPDHAAEDMNSFYVTLVQPTTALASRCGLLSFDIRVILGGFSPVEYTVITDNANSTKSGSLWKIDGILKRLRCSLVLPRHHEDDVPRCRHRFKQVPRQETIQWP